jgi:hypothetical protein
MAGGAKGKKAKFKPKLVREPSEKGVFRYRSKAIFVIAAVLLPLTGLFFGFFLWDYLNGKPTTDDEISQPTPLYAPFIAAALVLPWWVMIGHSILRYFNERIVVLNGRLKHYSVFGRLRVEVSTSQIGQYSFTSYPYGHNGSRVYSVTTPQGTVKWIEDISDCSYLIHAMQAASNRSALRIGSEKESGSRCKPG